MGDSLQFRLLVSTSHETFPKLQYELEKRFREKKMQETLLTLLSQRFEIARVNEARDTSDVPGSRQSSHAGRKSAVRGGLSACFWGSFVGWCWGWLGASDRSAFAR